MCNLLYDDLFFWILIREEWSKRRKNCKNVISFDTIECTTQRTYIFANLRSRLIENSSRDNFISVFITHNSQFDASITCIFLCSEMERNVKPWKRIMMYCVAFRAVLVNWLAQKHFQLRYSAIQNWSYETSIIVRFNISCDMWRAYHSDRMNGNSENVVSIQTHAAAFEERFSIASIFGFYSFLNLFQKFGQCNGWVTKDEKKKFIY